jgi:hypothetical protein
MKSSLFWDVTQRLLVVTDVSGQPIGPIFKGQEGSTLTLEDGTDKLSRNVELPLKRGPTGKTGQPIHSKRVTILTEILRDLIQG